MRKFYVGLLALFVLLALGACNGKSGEGQKKQDEAKGKKLEKVTVMLDWYPNAVHSYLYVAKEKGYFADEGLDVEFKFPANPTDPLSLAASGNVTMGMYYQPDVIMARANENIPVKAVAAVVRSPLNHLVFKADAGIKSPKDLEGKKVGYSGVPVAESMIKTMVEDDGGDYGKVKMVDVGFDLIPALVSGNTDAVTGMYINHEVPILKSEGHKVKDINPGDYGVPSYYELVAVTSDATWNKQQKEIEAFWRAADKGFEFMDQHPKDALKILLDNQDKSNFPLDEKIETDSMNILLPKMRSDEGFGSQEAASWDDTGKWLKDAGLIQEIPASEDLFINIKK